MLWLEKEYLARKGSAARAQQEAPLSTPSLTPLAFLIIPRLSYSAGSEEGLRENNSEESQAATNPSVHRRSEVPPKFRFTPLFHIPSNPPPNPVSKCIPRSPTPAFWNILSSKNQDISAPVEKDSHPAVKS